MPGAYTARVLSHSTGILPGRAEVGDGGTLQVDGGLGTSTADAGYREASRIVGKGQAIGYGEGAGQFVYRFVLHRHRVPPTCTALL